MTQQIKKERKEKKEKNQGRVREGVGEKREGGSEERWKEAKITLESTVVRGWMVLRSCTLLTHLEILFWRNCKFSLINIVIYQVTVGKNNTQNKNQHPKQKIDCYAS